MDPIIDFLLHDPLGNVAGAAILVTLWNAILRALTPDQRYRGRWSAPGRRLK